MIDHPSKLFPCDCMGEGITVSKLYDTEDISENEVMVKEDKEIRDCEGSPFIQLSFWEYGHSTKGRWSWWWRLKIAWYVFRKGSPWPDMVVMKVTTARNLANHILYIIKKGEREKKREPLVISLKGAKLPETRKFEEIMPGLVPNLTIDPKSKESKEPGTPDLKEIDGANQD